MVVFLFSAFGALGCTRGHLTECERAALPFVFIGKVVAGGVGSIREDPWYSSSRSVRFEVIGAFRGPAR